jgi:hypothetical protein
MLYKIYKCIWRLANVISVNSNHRHVSDSHVASFNDDDDDDNTIIMLIVYYQQMHLMLILFNLKCLKQ